MVRAVVAWKDHVPDRDGVKNCVYDIAFRPDGMQLIAAVGSRVLIYDAVNGDLLHSLKGHKDTLYCVAYSRDGKRFASGGADKTIIIWTSKAEGILKYSHNESIQCLAYNSVTQQLASATATDFGLWSPEQKSVAKHKVTSRVLCMSWTNDGTCLSLGHYNGQISLRDKSGAERLVIERNAPVWSLQWNPSRDEAYDLLAVASWDQTLSFYELSGVQHGRDRPLGCDPCCIRHFSNGEYMCLGGSDRKASLWTKEGVKLTAIAELEDWVWCCVPRPNHNYVAVGCNDGSIGLYQLMFATVHGLHKELYAYRDFMTDVIVHNLVTEQRLRIRCKDYIKKIAIYNNRLAVKLPEKLYLYELPSEEVEQEGYLRPREKLNLAVECDLLLVAASHFVICYERKIHLYTFRGAREREWLMDSVVRFAKLLGGPPGREGLLVGLENGQVFKIFIDNTFTISLVHHTSSIRCLDMNIQRTKLAVVDDNSELSVYDLKTKSSLYTERGVTSVAWNTELEDMLCFSGNGMLSIKTGVFPLHQQQQQGVAVGFSGTKVFCLHNVSMETVEVPQSASFYRYLESKDFVAAYRVACLGATESDWRMLAMEAMKALQLDVAKKALVRTKDSRYIELVKRIETERKGSAHDESVLIANVLAHQGKFQEAAKMYAKANRVDKAIELFSDLRMWDEAKQYSHSANAEQAQELVRKQAAWAEEVQDMSVASETYIAAGDYLKAIHILGEQGWVEKLAEVSRRLGKTDVTELRACLTYFEKLKAQQHCKEVLMKLDDMKGLVALHLQRQDWDEAMQIVKQHPEYAAQVYLPYAHWLVEQDRFDEAQDAFKTAGQEAESVKMLQSLIHNAVVERRYNDAGRYLWRLAKENLVRTGDDVDLSSRSEFWQTRRRSDYYFAFHSIHKFTDEPFTALTPDTVFNISRYLLAWLLQKEAPYGISKAYCIYALAKQSRALGANKLARFALEKLTNYKVPPSWQDQVDTLSLSIRARPFNDSEELLPSCYRCQTVNPLLNQAGDKCITCGHPFVRSFCSFELLPLVRFTPPPGMSDDEVMSLIRRDPPPRKPRKGPAANPWREHEGRDVQTLALAGDIDAIEEDGMLDIDDPFTKAMLDFEPNADFAPTMADRSMLLGMDRNDVFILQWPTSALPREYYRNMIPDVPIVLCTSCNHFFHEEDWEFAVMQKKACPFCAVAVDSAYGSGCVTVEMRTASHPNGY